VALIGVRISLPTCALPMIFVGALAKLLAGRRIAAAGADGRHARRPSGRDPRLRRAEVD